MPRALSEMYQVFEEPTSTTSTGTGDVKTVAPASGKRAVGVWISVETTDARVTFSGATPGVSTGPGIVVKAGASPQFYPFAIGPNSPLKFASNAAGNSLVSVVFVT
jgi:hypothetical protein